VIATELDPANSLRRTAKCISSTTAPNPPSRTSAISSIPSHPAKLWENEAAGHHAACAHMINLSAQERLVVAWDLDEELIA
jgi:hypothetical protein